MRDEQLENIHEARRVDLRSRIGARATVSGTLVALAVLGLLLSLIGALAPSLDVHVVDHFGFGTYLWALLSWVAAASAGAFIAARVGRARSSREGWLYGVVTWAAACITGAVLMCTWYMAAVGVGVVTPALGEALVRADVFRAYFAADVLALAGAIAGAVWATRVERRSAGAARGETGREIPLTGRPAVEPG